MLMQCCWDNLKAGPSIAAAAQAAQKPHRPCCKAVLTRTKNILKGTKPLKILFVILPIFLQNYRELAAYLSHDIGVIAAHCMLSKIAVLLGLVLTTSH